VSVTRPVRWFAVLAAVGLALTAGAGVVLDRELTRHATAAEASAAGGHPDERHIRPRPQRFLSRCPRGPAAPAPGTPAPGTPAPPRQPPARRHLSPPGNSRHHYRLPPRGFPMIVTVTCWKTVAVQQASTAICRNYARDAHGPASCPARRTLTHFAPLAQFDGYRPPWRASRFPESVTTATDYERERRPDVATDVT
jgi:hypothetical protein